MWRRTREAQNVTPCTRSAACLAAATAPRAPLKSESPSFLPDQTSTSSLRSEPRCSGRGFIWRDLKQRICSSARKWLFFLPLSSTVRGLPILDHVILFCRLVLGAYGGILLLLLLRPLLHLRPLSQASPASVCLFLTLLVLPFVFSQA